MSILFFFKQKTAYEMRISDWSSDVCSSDLHGPPVLARDDISRIVGVQEFSDKDIERNYVSLPLDSEWCVCAGSGFEHESAGCGDPVMFLVAPGASEGIDNNRTDRKSTRLNSSH